MTLAPSLPPPMTLLPIVPAGLDSEEEPRLETPVEPGHDPHRINDVVDDFVVMMWCG